jgi:hypothetical protein
MFLLVSTIEDPLHLFPDCTRRQRFTDSLVDPAGIAELARVNAIPKNLVKGAGGQGKRIFRPAFPTSDFGSEPQDEQTAAAVNNRSEQ